MHLLKFIGIKIREKSYIAEGLPIAESLGKTTPITMGDRIAIGPEVILMTSSHPNYSTLKEIHRGKKGFIIIHDDALIGAGAIIFRGITIRSWAVVGAGAVVIKNVPNDTGYVGARNRNIHRAGTWIGIQLRMKEWNPAGRVRVQ